MIKLKKIIMVILTMLLFSVSYLPQLQANIPETGEVPEISETTEEMREPKTITEEDTIVNYALGDYDILVPHDGLLKHPKDIEGFEFNSGQYPEYPNGWLNGLLEAEIAPRNSTITMGKQIGYVDGNGYRTFMNELYDNGGLGFCSERGKEPVSDSSNYNDGVFETSKKVDAIYTAYNDAYGIMGTTTHEYKYGVAQASVWHFEGTLDYNATIFVHGHDDVSGKFREVVDKVNDIWNGGSGSLGFNKSNLTTTYDATTGTLVTEPFRYTDASFDRDASISLAPGFYVTKASDNVAVSNLNKNQDFVIRTTNLAENRGISLNASITMEKPVGKLFSHLTMADTLQAILIFSHTDPTSRDASLNAKFEPAHGEIDIIKLVDPSETIMGVFWNNKELDKIKLNISKTDGTYSKDIKLDILGKAHVGELLPGQYTIKEIEVPIGLKLNTKQFDVTVTAGERLNFTLTNKEAIGAAKIIKRIDKTTNSETSVTHDFTKVKVKVESNAKTFAFEKEYYLNADGTLSISGLPIGAYKVIELEVPPTMQLTATPQNINVTSGTIATAVIATLTNTETVGALKITKSVQKLTNNNSSVTHDLTKIKVRVESLESHITYKQDFFFNAAGEIALNKLAIGKYQITEIEVPKTMELDTIPKTVEVVKGGVATAVVTHFVNKERYGALKVNKIMEKLTHGDAAVTHDLTKVKVKVESLESHISYNRDIFFNEKGEFILDKLAIGSYRITEIEVPISMDIDKVPKVVEVVQGEVATATLGQITNKESFGSLKVKKEVLKTTNSDAKITHDLTKIKVRVESQEKSIAYNQEMYLDKNGELLVDKLPVGEYKITELEVPPTLQKTAVPQKVTVVKGTATTAVLAKLSNTETVTDIHIIKTLTNTTDNKYNDNYTPDFTQIKIRVKSKSANIIYDKTYALDTKGRLRIKHLPYGVYEVTEVSVPEDMHIDTTVHTIVATENGKTYEVTFNNTLTKSFARVGKKDNNGAKTPNVKYMVTSDILRWEDGTPKIFGYNAETNTYSKDAKPKGAVKDPKNGLYEQPNQATQLGKTYVTDENGQFVSDPILYGFKNVYIIEVEVPRQGHLYLDPQPKLIKLLPEGETYIQFNNIIKEQGQIQVNKKDEDGKKVAWYFDIYARFPGETTDRYVETISTSSLDGIGRSTILQKNDANGNQVVYKVCEQPHPLYKETPCIHVMEAMWNSGKSVWIVNIKNEYKQVGAELWKILEKNMAGETAKGTEIVWKNSKGDVLGTFIYNGNGKVAIPATIRIDKLLDGKGSYVEETKYSEASVKESVKIPIVDIEYEKIKDGQILKLNTEGTAIINRATRTFIDKIDPDQKRVPGAGLVVIDPKTGKEIHKWIVKDKAEEITGLHKSKQYKVCETLVPAGYKEPKSLCSLFTTDKNGEVTSFNLVNEYTQLTIHKIGVPSGISDTLTGTQLPGAHLGIRLISRPDNIELGISEADQITINTNTNTIENVKTDDPQYSYAKTTGSTDITEAFLMAKIGDTVHEFVTTDQAEIIRGIPKGFVVEVYEITPPTGYEQAIAQTTVISGTEDMEVTLIDKQTQKLVETGQNVFAFGVAGLFIMGSGGILLFLGKKRERNE